MYKYDDVDDFVWYQDRSKEFALLQIRDNPEYSTLGLVGEAGEIANKVKKLRRDMKSRESIKEDIASEIGDCLWYLARLCDDFDLSLNEVAYDNITKLEDRKQRGVISGSGDNR